MAQCEYSALISTNKLKNQSINQLLNQSYKKNNNRNHIIIIQYINLQILNKKSFKTKESELFL